jgi:hypothetical protein
MNQTLEPLGLFLEAFLKAPRGFHIVFIALFAGLVGSFLNVCIWRIPRGESIVLPRSRCTSCGHILGVLDLFPILSYLVLRRRCRHCGASVSARYVIVEAINVTLWLSSYACFGLSWAFAGTGALLSFFLATTGIVLMKRQLGGAKSRGGFTFISILLAALLLAVSVGPFLDLARTGFVGASKNQEYIKAYALAQERIEELRSIPVANLKSDRKIYIETERLTDNIFCDEFFGDYARMRESPKYFSEKFTDVYTERNKLPDTVMEKFARSFKRYYGFDYQVYPAGYEVFRRITRIEEIKDKQTPDHILHRAVVTVEINSKITNGRKLEMEALLTDR